MVGKENWILNGHTHDRIVLSWNDDFGQES